MLLYIQHSGALHPMNWSIPSYPNIVLSWQPAETLTYTHMLRAYTHLQSLEAHNINITIHDCLPQRPLASMSTAKIHAWSRSSAGRGPTVHGHIAPLISPIGATLPVRISIVRVRAHITLCLLYTSDAADE